MTFLQTKMNQLEAYFERENARQDLIAEARPSWWNAGKIFVGMLCMARGVAMALHSATPVRYVLALLFVSSGAHLAYEGAHLLKRRRDKAKS